MPRPGSPEVALSVLRARAQHWLDAHPEPELPGFWAALSEGFASMFGDARRWPTEDPSTRVARSWARASVQTAEQFAAEGGIELFEISPDALPWWEASLLKGSVA